MKGILFGLLEEMRRCQFCIEIQEFILKKKKKLDGGDGRFWSLTVVLSFDFGGDVATFANEIFSSVS